MDLSGLIFVVLAVGWAGYLIPKALRHHEEIAASRPVDNFSETMRVLERTPATMKALLTPPAETKATAVPRAPHAKRPSTPARRRRRVLGLLLLVTAATAVAAYLAYLPAWSPSIPGALVVAWLALCRLMVRKAAPTSVVDDGSPGARPTSVVEQSPLVAHPTSVVEEGPLGARPTSVVEEGPVVARPTAVVEEGPLGARLETSEEPATVAEPVETDDGSLWDPLPLTLPTYVSKPAARRTVRTIDLTQTGVTSSGHHADDTELARKAESGVKAQADEEATVQRKVAGA